MQREEEIELARKLIAGESDAFDRFVDHFHAKIFHYSWLMCGQREDAEEVAQEALLKVFQSFDQLREPERVRPWVFRIARNACLMKRRRSVFAPAREFSLEELMPSRNRLDGQLTLQIADWSALPEDQLLRSELKQALEAAIAQLPDSYRSVMLLRDVEELSTQDAANILNLTEEVVRTRLHRARLAVRKTLDEQLHNRPVAAHPQSGPRGGHDGAN